MKKIAALLFLISMMILAACGDDKTSSDKPKEESVSEDKQTNEVTAKNDNENTDQNDDSTVQEEEDESSDSDDGTNLGGSAEQLFKKSAEAMIGVTSYLIEGQYTDNGTINGQVSNTTTLTMELSLTAQSNMHMKTSTTSDTDISGDVEMYKVDGGMYMKSPNQPKWFKFPASSDFGKLFNTLQGDQLKEYVKQSNAFVVEDSGDHYSLVFSGTDEEYKSAVMGAGIAVLEDTLKEHYDNMEVSGSYEIKIDKETFQMIGYELEYESSTTGEIGEIETYHKASYSISEFNEHDNITVPEEIVQSAVSYGQ